MRNEGTGAIWQERKQEYKARIKAVKEEKWREFVKEANEKMIWTLKKYMDSTPTSLYIPNLNGTAASNEQKAKLFQSTFFPQPPCSRSVRHRDSQLPDHSTTSPTDHDRTTQGLQLKSVTKESPRPQ